MWNGIGWFRLRLHVGERLRNATLALHPFHLGASEFYLDGEKVGLFGEIGMSAADEEASNPKGLPVGLHLDGRDDPMLAVRYAHRGRIPAIASWLGQHPRHPQGFEKAGALLLKLNEELEGVGIAAISQPSGASN